MHADRLPSQRSLGALVSPLLVEIPSHHGHALGLRAQMNLKRPYLPRGLVLVRHEEDLPFDPHDQNIDSSREVLAPDSVPTPDLVVVSRAARSVPVGTPRGSMEQGCPTVLLTET